MMGLVGAEDTLTTLESEVIPALDHILAEDTDLRLSHRDDIRRAIEILESVFSDLVTGE